LNSQRNAYKNQTKRVNTLSWIFIGITLWVQILHRQGVLDTTLCDKCCQWLATLRSVVLTWYSSFFHQQNWPPRYSWNIVERGVKHHKPNQMSNFSAISWRLQLMLLHTRQASMLSWIFIVLAHWSNSPCIDMSPQLDTLCIIGQGNHNKNHTLKTKGKIMHWKKKNNKHTYSGPDYMYMYL